MTPGVRVWLRKSTNYGVPPPKSSVVRREFSLYHIGAHLSGQRIRLRQAAIKMDRLHRASRAVFEPPVHKTFPAKSARLSSVDFQPAWSISGRDERQIHRLTTRFHIAG